MADDEYNDKLESLQQYIPFLNNMIVQLKDPRKKNREQQLTKMVSLHSMITDKKKKLKLETLTKCEDVILKLYNKVKSGSQSQASSTAKATTPLSILSPTTPCSPSPPRDMLKTKPVLIPTEKVVNCGSKLDQLGASFKTKIDIYSSAADSLKSSPTRCSVFERLGRRRPDMSKPPISMEDLEALQKDVDTERMSLNELTDLREKLQKQLSTSDESTNGKTRNADINTTVRNNTILTWKAVEKLSAKPLEVKTKTTLPTAPPVKVVKEATSIFGNTLSSIDNKILEVKEKERRNSVGTKKEGPEVKERRNSVGSKKEGQERRSSKDDKKSDTSGHKSSKDKTEKKGGSDHGHKSKESVKKPESEHKPKLDENKSKSKDGAEHRSKDRKDEKKAKIEEKPKEEPAKVRREQKDDNKKPEEENKTKEKPKEEQKSNETPPTYKRLADKYNPKPRKSVLSLPMPDVSQEVSEKIENSMRTTSINIPFLDPTQTSPPKQTAAIQPLMSIPILSPTSSTNSIDSEVAFYNKKTVLPMPSHPLGNNSSVPAPVPAPQNMLPTQVSNILSNPNATAIINNVVNQLKGGQATVMLPPVQNNFVNTQGTFGHNNYPSNEMGNLNYNKSMNNFWGNQQQNYPQRTFTPLPGQFEPQRPQMDYFPPGGAPPTPYNHQIPPLLSPQCDYDGRPLPRHERGAPDENLFGVKDRDMREWRRPQWTREGGRDYRDPRLNNRDPRSFRDDPRNYRRDYDRERERDARTPFRDPRLNRFSGSARYESSQAPRSRSISRDSDDSANTFASPLDSLYSTGDTYRKTGKGYGVQNFKIPKIKKEDDAEPEAEKETEKNVKQPEEEVVAQAEPKAGPSVVERTEVKETPEAEENVALTSVSSSTELEQKQVEEEKKEKEVEEESVEVAEISSTNEIHESESRDISKLDDANQTDIINRFLKKLLENERTRAAASLFIDNVSNSLDDDKLKMVVNTVKAAAVEDEEVPAKQKVLKKKKMSPKMAKKLIKRKVSPKPKRRSARIIKDDDDDDDDEEVEEEEEEREEEEVLVTVGERIKSRKRVASSAALKKKKSKHKSELDLLHEDIQDMFIRDGILTATGKRMCRLLKGDEVKQAETRTTRSTKVAAEKFDAKNNSEKLKAMSSVRVLLPKLSVEKLGEVDEDGQRYSLRRSNKSGKSYVEDESDEDRAKEEKKKKADKEAEEEEKSRRKAEEEKVVTSPKKVGRKRAKGWASGILPKRKRKESAADRSEEVDKSVELIEPDRNYYSDTLWHFKMACKLCDFNGKGITRHYRLKHPDSEILSSRLRPDKAEQAIAESRKLKLNESEDCKLIAAKTFHFKCRFCDLDVTTGLSNFYDHITTHTGEYRHLCTVCSYASCNVKPLRAHFSEVHGKDRDNKAICIRTKVYGYICLECNFVQTTRKHVENHVNVYHLGEGEKILKIYLSSLDHMVVDKSTRGRKKKSEKRQEVGGRARVADPEPQELETDKKLEEEAEPQAKKKKVEGETEPQAKKKKAEEETDAQAKKKKMEEETEAQAKKKKEEEETEAQAKKKRVEEETEAQAKKKKVEEETRAPAKKKRVEDEPKRPPEPVIKKEKEIDMTVFTCNTDLQEENDKIEQERLKTMTELNDSVKTNRQSLNFVDQLSSRLLQEQENTLPEMVVVKSEPLEPEPLREVAPRKPSQTMERPSSGVKEVVQKDNVKIQGMIQKLQGILKEEKKVAEPPPLAPLVEKPTDKSVLNAGFLNIIKDGDALEYACRVPSCLYTSSDRDTFLTHWNEDHSRVNQTYKATRCRICQDEVTANSLGHLLNNFFVHVENEHLGARKNVLLRTRRLSGDKLSTTSKEEEEEDFDKSEENPFPFTIAGVMSLAEDPVPPLSPIKEKSTKIESVVLKEAKMSTKEKAATWKCPEAMRKFLQLPRELYKCPQFFCKFATSQRYLFEGHIKAHAAVNDELVSCVYCDVKTPLSHAGLHIDLRHANCLYSCSQCLYRALTREYVMVHMKLNHKSTDVIVSLPPKTITVSKQKRCTVMECCRPYVCGNRGCCHMSFLFQSEYLSHLQNFHDRLMMCGYKNTQGQCSYKSLVAENMMDHWKTHGCYGLHCMLCKVGCVDLYTMLEHYAITHSNVEPFVADRRNGPGGPIRGYMEEAFSNIKYVKEDLLESVNSQKYSGDSGVDRVATPPTTASPKNVTLVPISIINSTENKKIIAIIPKNVDGLRNQSVQLFATPASTSSPEFVFASIPPDDKKDPDPKDHAIEPASEQPGDATGDPLSLEGEGGVSVAAAGEDSDSQDLNDGAASRSFGLIGYQLYRCAFCDISFSNAKDFKTHCILSKMCRETVGNTAKPFRCAHCERTFKNSHGLLEHIHYHGQLRFSCSLCVKKFPSSFALKVHMRQKHNVCSTVTTPLVSNKVNPERDEFVLRPVPIARSEGGEDGGGAQHGPAHKKEYSPEEVDQLPKRYIFNSDVKCALCPYSTKVRTNLVRHLQFHSSEKAVPDIAPVNPVPCLDKNEKMFDKMTNLAMSSNTGPGASRMGGGKGETKAESQPVQLPAYVPASRRYVCCASGCSYLCLEEANLRHHLHALHANEASYTCAHCNIVLKADPEIFLEHLKLHDVHLYKCGACPFVHNLRHEVDKHAADNHPAAAAAARTIAIRSLEAETAATDVDRSAEAATEAAPPANIKWTKPWHCGVCKYRCAAKTDIVTHVFNKHDINTQYKCTLCTYKTNEKNTFDEHFKDVHPDHDIDIIYVYYRSEGAAQSTAAAATQKQFDTTPLWQRDRPRVRHIRGILFEETSSPQKSPKKVLTTPRVASSASTSSVSNLDLAIDAVAKGTDAAARRLQEALMKDLDVEVEKVDDVIVIDDDDDDEGTADEGNLLIDVESDGGERIKLEDDNDLLSEELLVRQYGQMCVPVGKAFKCPICVKFRTKKISCFVYHLLTELKLHRFKCNSCDFSCVTFDTMVNHCQDEHNSEITSNVTDTPVEASAEYWMQLLIRHQAKGLIQAGWLHNGDEHQSVHCKIQCEFCQRWFKNIHLLKEHELYHWAEHTYTCGHCSTEHVTLNELFQHTFIVHPKYSVSLTTNGPYVSKVIATLKSPPSTLTNQVQTVPSSGDETLYACIHCPETDKTIQGLQKHYQESHRSEAEEFQYKVLTKAKLDVMYCCGYCHEKGSDKELKKHHQECHEGAKFNIYQYICLECSGTFLNIKDLRSHFGKTHPGKKLTYSCVENKQSGSKDQYCCTKCPFRSCSVGGIRSHLRKHLRPIDCGTCGATFIYPTEARAHHNREHIHNPESVEENKERVKEYEELVQKIIAAKEKAKAPPARKMLARKSTGAPFVREISFYGTKPQADLKNITTNIE